MNLEEALRMATNTVAEPVATNPIPVTPVQTEVAPTTMMSFETSQAQAQPISNEQLQAQAQVVQPTYTQPVAPMQSTYNQPAYTQPTQVSVPSVNVPGIDLNQAQEQSMAGYGEQSISFGQVMSTRAVETVKRMEKGESFRFTIVAPDIRFIKIHRHDTLGNIKCFSSENSYARCCQECGDPKPRYFLPVLVYSTMPNDPKTPLPQGKSELRVLSMWSAESFKELSEEVANNPLNFKGDFIGTCEDNFGKLKFRVQATSFRSMPEYNQSIQEAEQKWSQVKDRAVEAICRNMDATRYAQLTQTVQPPQMSEYSMKDIY